MTQFDCYKHHAKCEAMCCKCVPIEAHIYERNQLKLVRETTMVFPMEGFDPIEKKEVELVMPFTKDGYCPFLNKDYTCNIYDDRPAVCQRYGSEERSCLRCPYQDKDGRTRSRQESRAILRQAAKAAEMLINLGKSSKNSQASE